MRRRSYPVSHDLAVIDFLCDFAADELYLDELPGSCAVNLATGG